MIATEMKLARIERGSGGPCDLVLRMSEGKRLTRGYQTKWFARKPLVWVNFPDCCPLRMAPVRILEAIRPRWRVLWQMTIRLLSDIPNESAISE